MASRLVLGSIRVQEVRSGLGRSSWTIVWPDGEVHVEADRYLRRCGADQCLERVRQALAAVRKQRLPVTYPAIAGRTRVSRTFLYQNQQARVLMTEAISQAGDREHRHRAEQDAQAEASWRERALNTEDGLKAAHAEIRIQREQISVLMGQVRDMESDYSEESVQRLATENTALKQRARRLADENRSLEEKLQAARSNNRFLDKRIAALEADLRARPPAPSRRRPATARWPT